MKRGLFSIRKTLVAVSALVLSVALLSSCRKDRDNVDTPVAGLMAFNLSPDKGQIGIALSGNLLTNIPLQYTSFTGNYRNIFPGERTVESFNAVNDSTLASSSFNFSSKKYYSLFVVGNSGAYQNLVVHDNLDSLSASSGQAYVRYINAIPDSSAPTVTVTSNGTNVVNTPASFASVSEFTAVNSGNITVAVANGNSIAANRTFAVESGKVYTVLLVGVPGSTDTEKLIQIKYIQNGILTDDEQKN